MTELIGGMATLGASWIGMLKYGVVGTGIGYLIGYVAYFLVVRWVVRRDFGFRLTPTNRLILLVSLASVGLARLLGLAHLTDLRFPVAAGLALGFAFYAGTP